MRHIKLLITSFIAILGIIIYFLSVPIINEDALVKLTVEAGDEKLLEDIYFEGYIYDYSLFQLDSKDGVKTNENLPYLKKLDAPGNQSIRRLQEKYPDFINKLHFNKNSIGYYIINNKNVLISGHFENYEEDYSIDTSTVYLSMLNKETNKIITDQAKREHYLDSDQIEIVGMYEAYPVVKILYSTSTWDMDYSDEKSNLSVGEYNFETKNYTETSLLNENGSLYEYSPSLYNTKNNEIQIFTLYGNEPYNENGEIIEANAPTSYMYNFVEDTITPLKNSKVNYFIGNKNQLYALENKENKFFLQHYEPTGEKILKEVPLELEFPINIYEEYPPLITEIMNDQLFIVQSKTPDEVNQDILPSHLQIFDIHSGKSLLIGRIDYDTNAETNATEGRIDEIGRLSDFN